MIWVTVLLFLLLAAWLLLSPFEISVDTRVPVAMIRWINIGKAILVYENEDWWLKIQVVFFKKSWPLIKMIDAESKKKKLGKNIKRQEHGYLRLHKFFLLVKTFHVVQFEIAIDTDDVMKNAWIYPLNFFPSAREHLFVNFIDENYLLLTIRNAPWSIIYAWIK